MSLKKKKILVLYWYPVPPQQMRLAIRQHLNVMDYFEEKYDVTYRNTYDDTSRIKNTKFDVVILHTTLLCIRWSHAFYHLKWKLNWIKDIDCIKIAIPQDEYDHSEILDEWLYEWNVSAIFSCFDSTFHKTLYPIMSRRAKFYKCLTGYIDDASARLIQSSLTNPNLRPNHIVYRASTLPFWFGSHGRLKHRVGEIVALNARSHKLICDISTRDSDTIIGDSWLDFLASGRAVIGCESGSSVLDSRGEIKARIQVLLSENNEISFEELSSKLPLGWDNYSFFAISPRHFESVITRTCQALVEGKYDGILEPDKHFIPLKKDFSNIDEVLEKIKDNLLLKRIADQAYEEIFLSQKYSYSKFALQIDLALDSFL